MTFGGADHDPAYPAEPEIAHHRTLGEVGGVASVELRPAGTLDIESADDFRQTFTRVLESGVTQFFVDMGEVSYIDSTGLGSLMQLHRETKSRGGKTWFYSLTSPVQEIFSLTRLDKIIELYGTRQETFAKAEGSG